MLVKRPVIRIDITSLAFVLLIIPFYKPGYFDSIGFLDVLFNGIRVIFSLFIFLFYVQKEKRYTKTLWILFLFEISFLISNIINGISLYVFIKNNVLQYAIFLLLSMYSSTPKVLIKTIFIIAEILVYINLVTILIFPEGMYTNITTNWLLGYKNYYFPFFIGFLIVALLYNNYFTFSYRPYLLIITMVITLYVVESSTSLFVFVLFFLIYFLMRNSDSRLINAWTFTITYIVLFFILVLSRKMSLFSVIIENIFHKNMTLSGRTRIWDSVISLVKQKPIFGWGLMSYEDSIGLIGLTTGTHAHNTLLQFLYTGGIVSLILWVTFYCLIVNKLYKYRNYNTAKVITIALFTYSIGCLVETYSSALIFVMFALADNIDRIILYENATMTKDD